MGIGETHVMLGDEPVSRERCVVPGEEPVTSESKVVSGDESVTREGDVVSEGKTVIRESYIMLGDNQFTREAGITRDQMIGVVTAFYRGDKAHSVNEISYQIYCRLWYHSRPFRAVCSGKFTFRQLCRIAVGKLRRRR